MPLWMGKANGNTWAALEAMPALTEGFHHAIMVKLEQLVDVSQGLVLHPMPGFMVPVTNVSPGMWHPSVPVLISRKKLM